MALNLDQLWADALARFYTITDKKLDDKSLPLLHNLDDLKVELNKRQDSFLEFRKKRHALFDGMSKVLSPITMLANIADGGVSQMIPPSGAAFSAFNYLIAAAGNVSASYDAILDLFEELSQFTTRLKIHARQEVNPEIRGVAVEIFCVMIRICGYAGRLMKHDRFKEYLKKLYLGRDKEIATEIVALRRLVDTETRMVGALTLASTSRTEKQVTNASVVLSEVRTTVQATQLDIIQLRDQVSSLALKMNEVPIEDRTDVEEQQLAKIRLALTPNITPEEMYRALSGQRVPGTGDWVRDERLFKAWLDHEQPILWISGGPGAGKSYLSSNIIQLLTQLYPQRMQASSRVSVAYYFCKDNDARLRSFNQALRTLAFQICQNDPVYARYVARICSFPEDIRTTESLWRKLFIEFYSGENIQSMVYVLIDGIDEAYKDGRETFLDLLKVLQQSSTTAGKIRVQVLLVGRPELSYDIEKALEERLPTISVNAVTNAADIHKYVITKVAKDQNIRRAPAKLRDEIVAELTSSANGMFLWADLMLRELASKHRPYQMQEALLQAPKGLFDMIQHTLDRTRQDLIIADAEDFETLIAWVTCAKRPFMLGELDDVLKLTSEQGEGVFYLEGSLRKKFASFFTLNREDGRTTEELQMEHFLITGDDEDTSLTTDEKALKLVSHDAGTVDDFGEAMDIDSNPLTTVVTLAHASFGDFFRNHRDIEESATDHSKWSLSILKHLLRIFCDNEVWQQWARNSIAAYAACYWQDHLRDVDVNSVPQSDRVEIGKSLALMLRDREVLTRWAFCAIDAGLFQSSWVYTDDNRICSRQWLRAVVSLHTEEQRKAYLDVLIETLAKAWLQETFVSCAEKLFMVIKAYQDKTRAVQFNTVSPTANDHKASDLAQNQPDTIVGVARSFSFEENCHWNARVGHVLREAGHYEVSAAYFMKAIDTAGREDDLYRVYAGLGLAYARQERYLDAVEATEKGLEYAKDCARYSQSEKFTCRTSSSIDLLQWQLKLKDLESVIRLAKDILKLDPSQYGIATAYIATLCEKKEFQTAMNALLEAHSEKLEEKGYSRLTEWCNEMMWIPQNFGFGFYGALVNTCRAVGNLDFAKATYLNAIKCVKKTESYIAFWLQADYGSLLLRELHKPNQAAYIFEKILDDAKKSRENSASQFAKLHVIDLLCEIYFARALKGGRDSREAHINMEKLDKIWSRQVRNEPVPSGGDTAEDMYASNFFGTTRNSTLALASLHRLFGQTEIARSFLKEHLKLGLSLLTDNDPKNDWQGYAKIADVLSRAGDHSGALIAYALIAPKWLPDEGEVVPTAPSRPRCMPIGSAALWSWACDGPCSTTVEYGAENLFHCTFCIGKNFCKDCHKLLMDDKLGFNICGRDHEFLFVPEIEPFPKGSIPFDRFPSNQQEWLAKVRAEWGL